MAGGKQQDYHIIWWHNTLLLLGHNVLKLYYTSLFVSCKTVLFRFSFLFFAAPAAARGARTHTHTWKYIIFSIGERGVKRGDERTGLWICYKPLAVCQRCAGMAPEGKWRSCECNLHSLQRLFFFLNTPLCSTQTAEEKVQSGRCMPCLS